LPRWWGPEQNQGASDSKRERFDRCEASNISRDAVPQADRVCPKRKEALDKREIVALLASGATIEKSMSKKLIRQPAFTGEHLMSPTFGETPQRGKPVAAIGKPRSLGVAAVLGADREELHDLLECAGQPGSSPPVHQLDDDDTNTLSKWLREARDAHLLLFWQNPVLTLAQAMANQQSPDEALNQWMVTAEQNLALVRKNRRRITLVESVLARYQPQVLLRRLNERLALSLTSRSGSPSAMEAQNPLELLIADRAIKANLQALRVFQELQATSLPLGSYEELLPDPLSSWQAYHQEVTQSRADVESLKEKNQRLRQEQEQLKMRLKELDKEEDKMSSTRVQAIQDENDLLLKQLHHVQEELESYYLESRSLLQKYDQTEAQRKKLERQRNSAMQRARALQQKIDEMRDSRSWRLTKPLRAGNIFRRKRKS